jgi:ABC-2 type transport system ATP-binding protein
VSIITSRNLSKRYGRRTGIEQVDLDVPEGAIFGFLGPNGAGKTTAIRVLLGFLRPTGGAAQIFGLDCWKDSHRIKREVGYLPGDLRLYAWMTAQSAIDVVGRIRGRDLRAAGRDLADRFRLEMNVKVRRMSRGMRQKLGLVLALASSPRLLVLDEPTSGLDPLMRGVLASILRERADAGHTIFFSSHTLEEVEELCDRVAIVRWGRIVADERMDDLRARARREVTVTFADAAAAAAATPPPFLEITRRRETVWRAEFGGAAAPLVAWASGASVADITIAPPDLRTIFEGYYRDAEREAERVEERGSEASS